jgi:hypothetical protein
MVLKSTWASGEVLTAADFNAVATDINTLSNTVQFATTVTAGGTTTLTVASAGVQEFTGTANQTVVLPTTSVLAGERHRIINNSTGVVTVQSSNLTTVTVLATNTSGLFIALVATPTAPTHWDAQYFAGKYTDGKAVTFNNSLTLAGTDGTTMTFPSTSGSVVTGTVAQGATTNAIAQRDANANLTARGFIPLFGTQATAAGTTTLTVGSGQVQEFTGTSTQTCVLPTTGVAAGQQFTFLNSSTGLVTIQSSSLATVHVLAPATAATFTALVATPTTPAHWDDQLFSTSYAAGKKLTVNNSLTLAGTDATTMTFPTTSATIARTDAAQTFTGVQTMTNPTINAYTEGVTAIGTVTTASTLSIAAGTILTATLTASTACTFTMPSVGAGKSFTLFLKQAAATGNGTATFTGVKWGITGTPTVTATAGRMDIFTFFSDGTNWYGSAAQGYTY